MPQPAPTPPRREPPPLKSGERCKWYVSVVWPECGDTATKLVHVKTQSIDTYVPLCSMHLARHNDSEMLRRHSRKAAEVKK